MSKRIDFHFLRLKDFVSQMKRQNLSAHAASSAFFIILSLLPMLIMICSVLPFTPITEDNLATVVMELAPDVVAPLAKSLVREVYEKSAGILSVAAAATLWSAGKAILALMRGLNDINDVEEERNYFVLRLVASFYTLIMLVAVLGSLVIMVFGNNLMNDLLDRSPILLRAAGYFVHLRFLFVWVILTLLFSLIYAYVPDEKKRFREQLTGAMFSAIVWSVFSWGFSVYTRLGNAEGVYRSLSMITVVMLWLYFGMYIVLVGAYINRYLEKRS